MAKGLIYIYEMMLFIVPTLILIWISYYISILKSYGESLIKHLYCFIIAIFCIADMYVYGCFFRLKTLYKHGNDFRLILLQTLILIFSLFVIYYLQKSKMQRQNLNDAAIVEAVNEFPGGLGFFDNTGVPIMVNKKMYRLIYEILNIPFIDGDVVWKALSEKSKRDKYKLPFKSENSQEIYYKLSDGSIWCFKKAVQAARLWKFIQIEAVDVSGLASIADKINKDNEALKSQNKRIKSASLELERVNREKERYFAKVALHGEFGEYILWLRQLLRQSPKINIGLKELESRWYKAIDIIKGTAVFSEMEEMENELLKVGELIGCKIFFPEKKPYKKYQHLYYSAVREALSNAVRHESANELYIQIEENSDFQKIIIFDSGTENIQFVSEGNGLTSLHTLMKKEGAEFELETKNVFKMVIIFPYS